MGENTYRISPDSSFAFSLVQSGITETLLIQVSFSLSNESADFTAVSVATVTEDISTEH